MTWKRDYHISSNKHPTGHFFDFQALRCGAYWRVALKRVALTYFKEKLNENTHFMETRVQSNGHENASCESLRDSIVENMMK